MVQANLVTCLAQAGLLAEAQKRLSRAKALECRVLPLIQQPSIECIVMSQKEAPDARASSSGAPYQTG
jgi:hypothetical protein